MDDGTDDQCIDTSDGGFSSADDSGSGDDGGGEYSSGDTGSGDDGGDGSGDGGSYDPGYSDQGSGDYDDASTCSEDQADDTVGPRVDQQAVNDAGVAVANDIGGMIPFYGTFSSVVQAGGEMIDAAGDAVSGNWSGAGDHMLHAAIDGVGAVPVAGTIESGIAAAWDSHAQSQREEGASASEAPLFTDAWTQGAKDLLPNPFSDPDSWTPQGPAQ